MSRRLELHEKLCEILGSRHVYFQPPESVKLTFPCIIYELSKIETWRAEDRIYKMYDRYSLTFVTSDPDSDIPRAIMQTFKYCSHDRNFTSDNLNHTVLTVYY